MNYTWRTEYMPNYFKRYIHDTSAMGYQAEDEFLRLMEKNKTKCEKATKQQDMHEHWDYILTNKKSQITIDVKATKKGRRSDSEPNDSLVWIEFKNCYGNDGWLYSPADCIAFQVNEGFVIVNRKHLIPMCEKLVGKTKDEIDYKMAGSKTKFYDLYTRHKRSGTKDVITKIKKEDLLSVKHILVEK